jgi:hypothetical protein
VDSSQVAACEFYIRGRVEISPGRRGRSRLPGSQARARAARAPVHAWMSAMSPAVCRPPCQGSTDGAAAAAVAPPARPTAGGRRPRARAARRRAPGAGAAAMSSLRAIVRACRHAGPALNVLLREGPRSQGASWGRRRVHTFNTPRTTCVNITEILGYGLNNTEYLSHTHKCFCNYSVAPKCSRVRYAT